MGISFSLRGLLLFTLGTALFLGVLRFPHPFICEPVTAAATLAWLYAVLATILRKGDARCFWIGAAVFGGAYIAAIVSAESPLYGPFPCQVMNTIVRDYDFVIRPDNDIMFQYTTRSGERGLSGVYRNVVYLGYAYVGTLLGLVGALAGATIARRNRATESPAR